MSKKNKNKGKALFFLLIAIVVVILVIIVIYRKYKTIETGAGVQNGATTQNIAENVTNEEDNENENEESTVGSKKIDFLANVTEPKYFKSEKNIKIPVIIYHGFGELPKNDKNYKTQAILLLI